MEQEQSDLMIRRMMHDLRACVRAMRELPVWIREDLEEADLPLPQTAHESLDLLAENAGRLDQYLIDLHIFARSGGTRTKGQADVEEAWKAIREDLDWPVGTTVELDLKIPVLPMEGQDFLVLLRLLVDNALRHNDGDAPWLRIATCVSGGTIQLKVEDNGPGIAPQYREKVFGFLEKLASRSDVPGSGVGLATARRLCQGHGGTIHVEEVQPHGACFIVCFSAQH